MCKFAKKGAKISIFAPKGFCPQIVALKYVKSYNKNGIVEKIPLKLKIKTLHIKGGILMKKLLSVLFCLVLCLAFGITAAAADFSFTGTVKYWQSLKETATVTAEREDNVVIGLRSGASVTVYDSDGNTVGEAETDENGQFTLGVDVFSGIEGESEDFRFEIRHSECIPLSQTVTVKKADANTPEFTLERPVVYAKTQGDGEAHIRLQAGAGSTETYKEIVILNVNQQQYFHIYPGNNSLIISIEVKGLTSGKSDKIDGQTTFSTDEHTDITIVSRKNSPLRIEYEMLSGQSGDPLNAGTFTTKKVDEDTDGLYSSDKLGNNPAYRNVYFAGMYDITVKANKGYLFYQLGLQDQTGNTYDTHSKYVGGVEEYVAENIPFPEMNFSQQQSLYLTFGKVNYLDVIVNGGEHGTVQTKTVDSANWTDKTYLYAKSNDEVKGEIFVKATAKEGQVVQSVVINGVEQTITKGTAQWEGVVNVNTSGYWQNTIEISFGEVQYKVSSDNARFKVDISEKAVGEGGSSTVTVHRHNNRSYGITGVNVNGVALTAADYTLDKSAGTLTFTLENITEDKVITVLDKDLSTVTVEDEFIVETNLRSNNIVTNSITGAATYFPIYAPTSFEAYNYVSFKLAEDSPADQIEMNMNGENVIYSAADAKAGIEFRNSELNELSSVKVTKVMLLTEVEGCLFKQWVAAEGFERGSVNCTVILDKVSPKVTVSVNPEGEGDGDTLDPYKYSTITGDLTVNIDANDGSSDYSGIARIEINAYDTDTGGRIEIENNSYTASKPQSACPQFTFTIPAEVHRAHEKITVGVHTTDYAGNTDLCSVYFEFENSFAVTYDANGGTGEVTDDEAYKSGDKATVKSGKDLEKAGYKFIGWNTKADGSGENYKPGDEITVGEKDIVLYAIWEKEIYTVTYKANGGKGEVLDKNEYEYGDKVTVKSGKKLEKAGHKFIGWNTKADGSGKDYKPGDEITVGEKNIVLYALWEEEFYTVTYKANGGKGKVTDYNEYEYGDEITVKSGKNLERKGYNFVGWNTKADGSGKDYKPGAEIKAKEDITLYAVWKKVSAPCDHDLNRNNVCRYCGVKVITEVLDPNHGETNPDTGADFAKAPIEAIAAAAAVLAVAVTVTKKK